MTQHLFSSIAHHAATRPRDTKFRELAVDGSLRHTLTHAELADTVARTASALAAAYTPGQVIIVQGGNSIDMAVTCLAALAAGLRLFPAHPQLTAAELDKAAAQSGAAAVLRPDVSPITPARTASALRRQGAAILNQSSGTTSQPRIAWRDAAAIDAGTRQSTGATRLTAHDHLLGVVPLYHAFGQEHLLFGPCVAGACVTLCQGFDREVVLRELSTSGITVLPGVPFMYEILGQMPLPALPHLRLAFASGAPLPQPVYDSFLKASGIQLGQLYGTTETVSTTFNHPQDPGFDAMNVGLPAPGVEVRVLDIQHLRLDQQLPANQEGHIAIRAASLFSGYLGETGPALTDGFFLSGDLGCLNEHGALRLTGRLKLLIDISGMKVNPLEVEAVIMEHPAVAECIVVPVPVSQTLVRLKAVVALRQGAAATTDALRDFARTRLSSFKVPRLFEIRPRLPKTPTGKTDRQRLLAGG